MYAQLMEWCDEQGNTCSYEFDYGSEDEGYESEPFEAVSFNDIRAEIERRGWRFVPLPSESWDDPVWRMYQERIDGMPELGAFAICRAVFEMEDGGC